jgi:O-antigen/teichoic acid export membrane protein
MGKHGTWAVVTLIEGISNLILSILLVRPYGIVGDALGTAIPLACSQIFFMPSHVCGRLGIRVSSFLREAYVLPLIITSPLVLTLLLLRRWFVAHTYLQLALQLSIAGAVYGLGLLWAFLSHRALKMSELALTAKGRPGEIAVAAQTVPTYQQDV